MAGSDVPAIDGPAGRGAIREPRTGRSWGAFRPARTATGVLVIAARARVRLGALAVCHNPVGGPGAPVAKRVVTGG